MKIEVIKSEVQVKIELTGQEARQLELCLREIQMNSVAASTDAFRVALVAELSKQLHGRT